MLRRLFLAASAAALMAGAALAADDKPAVLFDIGGKFDKSFNEGIYNGAEKFKTEAGVAYGEFEISNEASASRRCAISPTRAIRRSSPRASPRPRRWRRWPRSIRT